MGRCVFSVLHEIDNRGEGWRIQGAAIEFCAIVINSFCIVKRPTAAPVAHISGRLMVSSERLKKLESIISHGSWGRLLVIHLETESHDLHTALIRMQSRRLHSLEIQYNTSSSTSSASFFNRLIHWNQKRREMKEGAACHPSCFRIRIYIFL